MDADAPLPVCILTDYGLTDEWAGVLERVVVATAPHVRVVHLTHGIPRQDVRAGALALWRMVPWLAPAVVLAVVDPGVATDRRAVAVEVATAGAGSGLVLVGPDNGLLLPAAIRAGGVRRAVSLDDPRWHAPERVGSGATFAGRDVFAPVAAHLAAGVDLQRLGPLVDPATLAGEAVRLATGAGGGAGVGAGLPGEATVLWVDTFGNVELDVAAEAHLPGAEVEVTLPSGRVVRARAASSYAALGAAVGLVPDSAGLLALCVDRGSAAAVLGLAAGDRVGLAPASRPG